MPKTKCLTPREPKPKPSVFIPATDAESLAAAADADVLLKGDSLASLCARMQKFSAWVAEFILSGREKQPCPRGMMGTAASITENVQQRRLPVPIGDLVIVHEIYREGLDCGTAEIAKSVFNELVRAVTREVQEYMAQYVNRFQAMIQWSMPRFITAKGKSSTERTPAEKKPAPNGAGRMPAYPDLDANDTALLEDLDKQGRAVAQEDLAVFIDLGAKATRGRIKRLRDYGFTIQGTRGEIITEAGKDYLKRLREHTP